MNGLFNLPAPLFDLIDHALAGALPSGVRIALWAVVTSLLSMGLYWLLSPQSRIAGAKAQAREARRALEGYDGDLADAGPLIRAQFAAVFRQIAYVLPASLAAIVPVLCVLSWADARFSYTLPAPGASPPELVVEPSRYEARWSLEQVPARVIVSDPAQPEELRELPITHAIPVIEQRRWWHALFGNPLGYLPDAGGVTRIEMRLPSQRHQPFGPEWLGSWLAIFLPVMVLASFTVLRVGKIH